MQLHDIAHTLRFGAPLAGARGVLILVHGRGSSADDIAGLARALPADGLAFLVPEAMGNTWYPQRFLAPLSQNEPWLGSALAVIEGLVAEALAAEVPAERIGLIGFSQGACLVLEHAARVARPYGFVAGLSGALIGPIKTPRTAVDLRRMPVLLGCAAQDAHIPLVHVEHSAGVLTTFNADVSTQVFPGSAHTVFAEEIAWLRDRLAGW